ncbi:MAG: hypothetical protein JRE10_15775 [Deltaproteobacteria bacterium]|nr:hypothetical protein [Deltaproteobacteria bacterium]
MSLKKKKKRLDFFLVLFTLDAADLRHLRRGRASLDFCNVEVNNKGLSPLLLAGKLR